MLCSARDPEELTPWTRAEMMRRLDVLNNTLAQNTKYIVPANAGLINVLGLEGMVPVKPAGGDVTGPAGDAAANARSRGKS